MLIILIIWHTKDDLANKIDNSTNPLSYMYVNGTMNYIVIPKITQEHVRRVVKSLKCSAPGWDGLPASVGKQCIDSYIEPSIMMRIIIILVCRRNEGNFP